MGQKFGKMGERTWNGSRTWNGIKERNVIWKFDLEKGFGRWVWDYGFGLNSEI